MMRRFGMAVSLATALTCALAYGNAMAGKTSGPSLTTFEDPGRTIARDAFAWGSVLYARASQLDARCWRIVWKDPGGNVVRTDVLSGTAATRDIPFTLPAIGPSGSWTAELQQGDQNPGGSDPCLLTTSYTVRTTGRFDVARVAIIGAIEGAGLGGDATAEQQNPGTVSAGGTGPTLSVRSDSNKNKRTYVRFDLTGSGVSGAVGMARLRLFMSAAPAASRAYEIRRATAPWLETTLTWNNRPPVTAGATDAQSTGTTSGLPMYWLVAGDVLGFTNGTFTNHGWEIRDGVENLSGGGSETTFGSSEGSTVDKTRWPVLLVDYDLPPVAVAGGPYLTSCRSASIAGATALDPEGEALTYSWSSDNPGVAIAPASGTLAAASGTRDIPAATATLASSVVPAGQSAHLTLTIGDGHGNTVTSAATVTFNDDVRPQITAPASVTAKTSDDGPGNCTTTVSLGLPAVSDNCTLPSRITVANDAPATFPKGQTTVTWTATDESGNRSTATQTVTVSDDENPTLSGMPAAITVGTGPGATTTSAIATWTPPIATDNCPGVKLTSDFSPGRSFPLGPTTVTYTATDAAGHTTSQSFTVTVVDDTKPVIAVGANVTAPTDAGQCAAHVASLGTTASDNAPGVTLTGVRSDGAPVGNPFPAGVTTIAWTATDAAGNTATASQTVTVNDGEPPALSGVPAAVTVGTGPGATTTSAIATWTPPIATDNCPGVKLTSDFSPGRGFPLGPTTVTYTATDAAGHTTSQSFTVTVVDDTKPVIAVGANVTVPTDAGQCAAHVASLGTTASDNAPGMTLAGVRSDGAPVGDPFPAGVTTIAWTATDASGNTATASQTVTVNDEESPVLSGMPAAMALGTGPDATTASAVATWKAPVASDNCPGVKLSSNHNPGESFPLGPTTVTYTATDAAGHAVSQSFTVTVTDDTPPVIAVSDLTVPTDDGQCSAHVAKLGVTANDNVPGVRLVGVRSDGAPVGDPFPAGVTTIAWTATDGSGNTATASQTVTVNDVEPPTLSGMPAGLVLGTGQDSKSPSAVANWTAPVAADNCPGVTLTSDHQPGETFPVGVTTVTYTATDAAGHATSRSFTVTVKDDTPPAVAVADVTVTNDSGQCAAHVANLGAAASDNVPGVTLVGVRGDGARLDDPYPGGATAITWTATDAAGNSASATQHVIVRDVEKPVILVPTGDKIYADGGEGAASDPGSGTVARDNCPGVVLEGTRSDGAALTAPFPLGTTVITWRATDASGNQATATQRVTVADDKKPVIALGSNLTVPTDPGRCDAIVGSLGTTATDNRPGVTLAGVRSDGAPLTAPFPSGTTTIQWTATDAAGNTSIAKQTVTVKDEQGPVLADMPADIEVGTGEGATTATAVASWTPPTASDNCPGNVTLRSSHNPGDTFPVGATTVTYTATDATGNTTNRSFKVTVIDDTPPTLAVSDLTVPTDAGQCSARVANLGATANDNAPGLKLVGVRADGGRLGDPFRRGPTQIAWTATDAAGNSVSQLQTVTVNDVEPPTLSGMPTGLVFGTGQQANSTSAVATWAAPVATDNCSAVTLTSDHQPGETFPLGVTTVTYTATDLSGNVTSRSFTVTVKDDTPPAVAVADVTVANESGQCAAHVANLGAAASDNLPGVTLVGARADGALLDDPYPGGATAITWTATDAAGNITSATQHVIVRDVEKPVILVPTSDKIHIDDGSGGTSDPAFGTVAKDNCPGVVLEGTRSDGAALGAPFALGTTVITWRATDLGGNQTTATQTITVRDHENPVIAVGPNLTVPTDAGRCDAIVSSFGTTATDNLPGVTLTGARSDGQPLSAPFTGNGMTTIRWTAKDAAGNTSIATQTVTVRDEQGPALGGVPADIEVGTGEGATTTTAVASWTPPTTGDNCPGRILLRANHNPGETFPLGVTTVTYTAIDAFRNTTSRSFKVTVIDDTPPTLTVSDLSVFTDPGQCVAHVANFGVTATDNAPGVKLVGLRADGSRLGDPFRRGLTVIAWTATDAAGNSVSAVQTVTVSNPPPVPTIIGPPVGTVVATGLPVSLTGSFTDNPGDVHGVQWMVDAQTVPATVDESGSTVSGSYAFPQPGVYMVQLPISDQCGGSGMASQIGSLDESIVVVDTQSPFVVGGGWMISYPGALRTSPGSAGEAGFGFVSKTAVSAGPADGAEFYFQLNDFRFHASSYDSLAVAGGTARYRGTGTVNGAGSYGFLLSAVDGGVTGDQVDRLRVRITDGAGSVVYDNEATAPDTASAATPIASGSIQIAAGTNRIAARGRGLPVTRPADEANGLAGNAAPAIPTAYALQQSFPNPFAGSTGVHFDLPEPSTVSVAVFDLLGRQVVSLVRGELPAGRHLREWNPRDSRGGPVPAGVYILRMEATPLPGGRTFAAHRKLVLLP